MLCRPGDLARLGLRLEGPAAGAEAADDLPSQDEWATLLAKLCFSVSALRLRRQMWMLRGWPSRSVLFLSEIEG